MSTVAARFFLASLLFATVPSLAHEAKGPNGGRVLDAGANHVELVGKGTSVEVFVTDGADKPVPTEAIKGLAILVVAGKSHRIPLSSVGGNKLSGTASVSLPAIPKGVVQITLPNGKTAQAKFN
jgi:hypothetical protein